ncbi:hypothetical protein P4055_10755 [Pseudomonas aeruginosa]|nr:hypothetical protein [Pseudomonas aeruginosa]
MLGENATEVAGPAVGHASLIAALEKVRQVAQALVAVATALALNRTWPGRSSCAIEA